MRFAIRSIPCSLSPVPPSWHFRFQIDSQGVSDSIDVVEVRDHLHGIKDVAVPEAVFSQVFYIPAADGGGRVGHPHSEPAERLLPGGKPGAPVVSLHLRRKLFVPCFSTEILPVRFDSIKTLVSPGDHRGQHFPFGA